MNSYQNYTPTIYINLHILLNILYKTTSNIQESRKSIRSLKRQQELIKKSKSFMSCSHMNCCLLKYTIHQFTYFIYYSNQDKFKNSRIIKIHQVHQKLQAKQLCLFCLTCFLFSILHLNLKSFRFSGEFIHFLLGNATIA